MANELFPVKPVLIIDDEPDILEEYRLALRINRINNIILCNDSRKVETLLNEQVFSLVILDLLMPNLSGMEILDLIKLKHPDTQVIIITGSNDVPIAVDCMRKGALDFQVKPVDHTRIIAAVQRANELAELRNENEALRRQVLHGGLRHPEVFESIITITPAMKAIFCYIEAVASSTRPILITGESGTGKELVAKAIHDASGRTGPFIPVNIGGIDDQAFSDTLFGHCKGAFTGADSFRSGLIEKASGGTLFLDEIGTLEIPSQVKLLRVLQEKQYYPLGSDTHKTVTTSIITATNENIAHLMKESRFRNDLYYRLKTHHLHIPPLRKRTEDIPLLVRHFAALSAESNGGVTPEIPAEIFGILAGYAFPGNVRELQALIHDLTVCSTQPALSIAAVKEYVAEEATAAGTLPLDTTSQNPYIYYIGEFPTMGIIKNFFIEKALKLADGNQTVAAQMLGISQPSLSRWMKTSSAEW